MSEGYSITVTDMPFTTQVTRTFMPHQMKSTDTEFCYNEKIGRDIF